MRRLLSFTALAWALAGGTLSGQEYRGVLLGRVTDATDAIIPSANVTVVNEVTNVASVTRTNSDGNFLAVLEPGVYNVTVEAPGFKKRVSAGIAVRTGDRLTLNFQIEVGSAAESITVAAVAPLLQTANADSAQVVDRRFLDLLFVPERNPLNLATLTPGVTLKANSTFADSTQNAFSIHGGGATTGNNEMVIDGSSVVMPRQGGSFANNPGGDAVEEVRIQTTMFDAAFGHSNGGVVIYATRRGTNQLHGSFEGFYRDRSLEANGWTNNRNGLPQPEISRRFYSGTVGGPVYLPKLYSGKNRTFFFYSMERQTQVLGKTFLARTFTDLERSGDFSQTLNAQGGALPIYDPFSTKVTGSTAARTPFPGSRIPASALNPTGTAIAAVFPAPNLNVAPRVGLQNWGTASNDQTPGNQLSARIDHAFSDRQRFFGRFAIMRDEENYSGLPRGASMTENFWRHYILLSLNHDFLFSPTLFVTFRYSGARYSSDTWQPGQLENPAEVKMPAVIVQNALFRAWPYITVADNGYGIGGRIKYRANDVHSLVPAFTKMAANHSVRFGADLRLVNWNSVEPGYNGAGAFSFNNTFTRSDPFTAATGNTTGIALASLVLGVPASGSLDGPTPYALRHYYFGGFVQDDWKVTPRLTINIGVRYEVETPYRERYDRLTYGFDFNSPSPVAVPGLQVRGGLLFAGTRDNPRWQGHFDGNNFGPRFGLAYQAFRNTVVRAGYGLFYSSNTGNLDTTTGVPSTYNVAAPYVGTIDGGATPFTTLSNPYPNGLPTVVGNTLGLASLLGSGVSFVNQGRVLPYTQQVQVSVQQSLFSKIRLEAAFLHMRSLKGLEGFNLNELPDRYLAQGAAQNVRVANPFWEIYPASTSIGSSNTIVQRQLWLAYPQFTGVTMNAANTRATGYNAFELSLEKRLSGGLTVLANYTKSKMIENNITSLVNTRHYRSISDLDIPHVANVAYVYELPLGRGKRLASGASGLLDKVIGGWITSGRLLISGGLPLGITDTNGRPIRLKNASKSGAINERLGDRIDPATRQVLNPYFDTTAFLSLPTQYMVAPEPPNFPELRAPGRASMDMSLVKRFTFRERLHIDVRADASNLTNTPQFDAPGTNLANKATFGVIQTAGPGRSVQFAFRAVF